MRLYKVVILVNVALAAGFLLGYHWWSQENARLGRELRAARQAVVAPGAGEGTWSAKGIYRGLVAEQNLILVTHEEIPGLMSAMTMGFPLSDSKLPRGLSPGDRIAFTLKADGNRLVVVALRKEASR
ncbi:MAG: copper-binding protein [candidate division NC10 bacterium]|nr:copper-binding protein [candidate division NC10 bacterium]